MAIKILGIIGNPLGHSFSAVYFGEKFLNEGISGYEYRQFPLESVDQLPDLINLIPELVGLNVTIPYKKQVIQYLDEISEEAAEIGAVNTIKILRNDDKIRLKGFNTDIYGFMQSVKPELESHHKKALILGTGGAAAAVAYAFDKLGIEYLFVSRKPYGNEKVIYYSQINQSVLSQYFIIVNTTPLGMYPKTNTYPDIPYEYLDKRHLLVDLVYNPTETMFLSYGKHFGAKVKNGLQMLHLQADKAWEIFKA